MSSRERESTESTVSLGRNSEQAAHEANVHRRQGHRLERPWGSRERACHVRSLATIPTRS